MTEPARDPVRRYRLSFSEHVRIQLRKLAEIARERGLTAVLRDALTELSERLAVYPQFGDPLRDMPIESMQQWIATVPPLVVQYMIDEENHVVMVGVPLKPLPRSGLD